MQAELSTKTRLVICGAILAGQSFSVLGSSLTSFALGIWTYQQQGSVTHFGLILLFTALPGILLSPLAGTLIDRWDRRKTLIFSDVGAGLATLAIAILLSMDRLEVWHIYLASAVSAIFNAFQVPAYLASISLLAPKQHLGRINGLMQGGQAIAQLGAPLIAGAMLAYWPIQSVILVDVATCIIAIGTLLAVTIPNPPPARDEQAQRSLGQQIAYGWRYITARPGLRALLLLMAMMNFVAGSVEVLLTPLIISFTSVEALGQTMTTGGLGLLVGSLLVGVWGVPKRTIVGLFGSLAVMGAVLLLAGLKPNVVLIGAAAFVYLLTVPFTESANLLIWQQKVPPAIQGRVFALRRAVVWSTLPLAYLVAGPLADRVFEPMLVTGGALAGTLGPVIGTGPGRGVALLMMLFGTLTILSVIVGYLYPPLRDIEEKLPDVANETAMIAIELPPT